TCSAVNKYSKYMSVYYSFILVWVVFLGGAFVFYIFLLMSLIVLRARFAKFLNELGDIFTSIFFGVTQH
ncbi:hypothetical protein, partial [Yersinia rochesterensis]|uniref:hypothetical protein n=1 Tax=Yersinia rochesterensis TaxID=1604335 RepID=UPI001C96FC1A